LSTRFPTRLLLRSMAIAGAALLLRSAPAHAEDERIWGNRVKESPQHYALELRFGPYVPRIDDDFRGQSRLPYASVFGDDRRLAVGVELDWQAFRIPMVGTIGPALGWSYTHMSSRAVFGNGEVSAEDTGLGIMPMYAVGVFRIDALARQTPIPLVAYGKAGLGYGLWWSGNDAGTQLRGHSWGTHLAVGGMLLLDALDTHAATELDNETGINNSYFFFEWMDSRLGGLSSSSDHSVLRIGTGTWMMGLALEM
jgi:hypothetical protein